jgi:hypothetical protein
METVKCTFEKESGERCVVDVILNREDNEMTVKANFEPELASDSRELYANLALMFVDTLNKL